MCELIFKSKKKKKRKSAGEELKVKHSPEILSREEKPTTTTTLSTVKVVCFSMVQENPWLDHHEVSQILG